MNTKEAYKIGFMLKCAELGVDPEKAARDLVMANSKSAFAFIGPIFKGLSGLGSSAVSAAAKLGPLGLLLGISAPVAAGGFAGSVLADASNPPVDIKQIKSDEERREYENAIKRLQNHLRSRGVKV